MNKGLEKSELEDYLNKSGEFREKFSIKEDIKLELLGHGEYNINYIFKDKNLKKFVVRQNIASQMHLDNQIEYEYRALKLIEESKRTPRAIFLNKNPDFLIMEYLEGVSLDYKKDLKIAANILADIHLIRVDKESEENKNILLVPKNPLIEIINECEEMFSHYEKDVEFSDILTKKRIRHLLDLGHKSLKESKEYNGYRCVVNTELNSSNFLINGVGKCNYLIDWEKPVYGDPVQDLSHFLVATTTYFKTDTILNKKEIEDFVDEYIRLIDNKFDTSGIKDRLKLYLSITSLRGLNWSSMAYIEYMKPDRVLKNEYTFNKIKAYLSEEFLDFIEDTYFK